ncbi:cytochrome P450 87A3-like [Rhodamnia argentea]|uniref:Cytochrome P450 87A3-like n=1 Tax=Rhodamnia argentea TaxID=178133 RepID=A0ABM3HXX8_9MYRT|nr:cytochrome P450 87A3-like [Rhodamnia argentea]
MLVLQKMVKDRVSSLETPYNDFLSRITADIGKEEFLTEDSAVLLIFALLFVGSKPIPATLTLAIMFLEENPKALQELTDEHEAVLRRRESSDSSITWEEYKSMPFTLHVIHETLRLRNTAPGLLRRTKEDVKWNRYTIPAGWGVLIATSAFHLDPETHKDPTTFNPRRWKVEFKRGIQKFRLINKIRGVVSMNFCPRKRFLIKCDWIVYISNSRTANRMLY